MNAAANPTLPAAVNNPPSPGPLARYLPPLPAGMAAAWLAENAPPGSLLLDPLGASPALALEAARAGYRVIVASNNPVISFIIETLAYVPRRSDFQSALAALATAKRGGGGTGSLVTGGARMEQHIQALYTSDCPVCGESNPVHAFLWHKGEAQPFARLLRCPRCGDSAPVQREISHADLDRLEAMGGDRMQRARALQRVILDSEEHEEDVEEALSHYLPRPLYVLFTMINRAEGLGLPAEKLALLRALLLSTFDAGNTLWGWPTRSARPRLLGTPPQFRENNLWMALEAAVDEWTSPADPEPAQVEVTRWPELPQGAGICLFRGRVRALMPLPETMRPAAVLTVFPRPNQAFWTLSTLWSGWLWGAEAALPLRNVLERRRYDWNWHTQAVFSALSPVSAALPGARMAGLLPELAPGFLGAVVTAAGAAGFSLGGVSLRGESAGRPEGETALCQWTAVEGIPEQQESPDAQPESRRADNRSASAMEAAARESIRAELAARNEPAPYMILYAAGLSGLAGAGIAPHPGSSLPGDLLTRVQAALARTLADRSLLRLYPAPGGAAASEEERGMWWLAGQLSASPIVMESGAPPRGLPLADRVEIETVRFIQKAAAAAGAAGAGAAGAEGGSFSASALDAALHAQFRGLQTPPAPLVRACLESYAEQTPGGLWRQRPGESSAARRADLLATREQIERLGGALGFTTTEQEGVLAWERAGKAEWWFFRAASAILSRYALVEAKAERIATHCVVVLPGSRARLMAFKLRRDPRLAATMAGWRFLKFRLLRQILASPPRGVEDWERLLDADPLTEDAAQMKLFEG